MESRLSPNAPYWFAGLTSRFITRAVPIVLSLVLGACGTTASKNIYGHLFPNDQEAHEEIDTFYGNYLAARQAMLQQDNKTAAVYFDRALESDPDNAVILEKTFLLEVSAGEHKAARVHAKEVVAQEPTNRIARLVLGIEELRLGRSDKARQHFQLSAKGLYNDLAIDLITAWTYAGDRKIEKAGLVLSDIQALGYGDLFQLYHFALMNEYVGDLAQAEESYVAAVEVTKGASLRVTQAYGQFLERQARSMEALDLYRKFLDVAPGHPSILAALDRMETGQLPEPIIGSITDGAAESVFSVASMLSGERAIDLPIIYLRMALHLRPELVDARLLLGELYQQNRQWAQSTKAFAAVPLSSPFAVDAAIQIAANLNQLERTDEAIEVLRSFLSINQNEIDAIVALGDLLRVQERFQEAVNAYNLAFKILEREDAKVQSDWFLHYARGVSLQQIDDWPAAEADLLIALDLAPEQPMVLNHLGYSWIERRYRVEDALALVQRAVDLSPNNGFIVDSLGWAYYRLEDYDRAVHYLERAVELEPDDPTLHDHLGDAYWMTGRFVEAGFEWSHALGLNPADKDAAVIEKKLSAQANRKSRQQ